MAQPDRAADFVGVDAHGFGGDLERARQAIRLHSDADGRVAVEQKLAPLRDQDRQLLRGGRWVGVVDHDFGQRDEAIGSGFALLVSGSACAIGYVAPIVSRVNLAKRLGVEIKRRVHRGFCWSSASMRLLICALATSRQFFRQLAHGALRRARRKASAMTCWM